MGEDVKIPVKIQYDGRGWDQLSQDARKAEREAMRATQQQIASQRKLAQLTRGLDRDLGPPRPGIKEQVTGGVLTAGAGVAVGLGAVELTKQAAAFTVASSIMAGQAETTEKTFVALSGGAASAASNLKAMDDATRGLISRQEQEKIASGLMSLGIADNAAELEKFSSGARRLGEIKGLGAAEAIDNLGAAIVNLSYERLDQVGISSGKVRDRVKELKDAGMGTEDAFKAAVFEQMDAALSRLGPEIETAADQVERMNARAADAQVAFGALVNKTGAFDLVVRTATIGLEDITQKLIASGKAMDWFGSKTSESSVNAKASWDSFIGAVDSGLDILRGGAGGGSAAIAANLLEPVVDWAKQAGDEMLGAGKAAEEGADGLDDFGAAAGGAGKMSEEAAKALKKLQDTQRSGVKDLIKTLEDYETQGGEVWDRWSDDVSELNQDTFKKIEDIQAGSVAKQKKIQKDLSKDLSKIDQDLGKDLIKAKQEITKRDTRASEDAARQERQTIQQSKIETLGDERLFQFEMSQLAAEGQGNAIKAAIERRAIEQQIEAEKTTAQQQASDEEAQVQATRQAEDDSERLQAIRDQAEEQRVVARETAAQDELLRQEELQKAIDDENAAYDERLLELQTYREEKLTELEEGKAEAIETLGAELAQMEGMTTEGLAKLAEVAGKYGKDVGVNFSAGIEQGLAENETVNSMLGIATPTTTATAARDNVQAGRVAHNLPQFANGGSFTVGGSGGTDSQLVQFMASPGEKVTVSQQGQVVLNVNGPSQDDFAAYLMVGVEGLIANYHKSVIMPWAQGA